MRPLARFTTLASVASVAVVAVMVAGCPTGDYSIWECNPTNPDPRSPCYEPEGGWFGKTEIECTGPSGQCVALGPLGWSLPALLWMGPKEQAPECPEHAPQVGYRGYRDVVASGTCETCACEPPVGSCALPTTLTAHAKTCDVPGSLGTSFNAPAGWDGSCTTENALPANMLCFGVPCVASLTIGPMEMTQEGCAPKATSGAGLGEPSWETMGVACVGTPFTGSCADPAELCSPAAAHAPAGFEQCIFQKGAHLTCPPSYPKKHVLFDGFDDTRACSTCTCDAPDGAMCTSKVSFYADGVCSTPGLQVPIASTGPVCTDLQPVGQALASKSASPPVYVAGSCAANGGLLTGEVAPSGPSTFCCQEE